MQFKPKWYPNGKKKKEEKCPVCVGKGRRRDAITDLERDCVACRGTGLMPDKNGK